MSIKDAFLKVREFHVAFNHPAPTKPTTITIDRAVKRAAWVNSEMEELLNSNTIEEQADAFIDALYFCLGGLVEMGIDPEKVFDIVHDANMSKLSNGKPLTHPDGKTRKPKNWVDPGLKIKQEIQRQLDSANELP